MKKDRNRGNLKQKGQRVSVDEAETKTQEKPGGGKKREGESVSDT